MRPNGFYGLHANGVGQKDQQFLLIGESGSGKTTLTLSLLQSGWRYLGDDVVVLEQRAQGVAALALQRGCACTPQTAAFFPALQAALTETLDPVRHKRQLALEACYGPQFVPSLTPRILLFPTVTGEPRSHLLPLDATTAMLRLMEQSAALLIEPRSAALQMAMLRQLLQQARAYRLWLGQDVYREPAAVAALLGAL